MHINTILVTRSRSCHVKTLHMMLRLNVMCMENGIKQEITYVNDDINEKTAMIAKKLKGNADKIIFIDFGVQLDHESLRHILEDYPCIIFPAAVENIDWNMFRTKALAGSNEPISQMGLNFDTEISVKIADGVYKVTKTNPKCWVMNRKLTETCLKQKKGQGIWVPSKISDLFEKLVQRNLKVVAYTKAVVTVTYPHECVSNILETAGVSVN